ncbi:MAG TPA: hypothetical protein ENK61_00005 [Devosia sp.]|nr:hypothetical protein [Devosia sp.]
MQSHDKLTCFWVILHQLTEIEFMARANAMQEQNLWQRTLAEGFEETGIGEQNEIKSKTSAKSGG